MNARTRLCASRNATCSHRAAIRFGVSEALRHDGYEVQSFSVRGLDDGEIARVVMARPVPSLTEPLGVLGLDCDEVTIAIVGKYMKIQDAYKSIFESLAHAGIDQGQARVKGGVGGHGRG